MKLRLWHRLKVAAVFPFGVLLALLIGLLLFGALGLLNLRDLLKGGRSAMIIGREQQKAIDMDDFQETEPQEPLEGLETAHGYHAIDTALKDAPVPGTGLFWRILALLGFGAIGFLMIAGHYGWLK